MTTRSEHPPEKAPRLEDMLEPGERVLWRDSKPRLFDDWPGTVGTAFLISGVVTVVADHDGLVVLATVLGIVLPVWLVVETIKHWFLPSIDGRTETVLTTARLLQRHSYAGDNFVEVPLAEISGITPGWTGGLIFAMRDGSTAGLYDPRQPQALAAAIVEAAGLPPPRLTGRLADLWDYGQVLGTPICFFLGAVLLPDILAFEDGGHRGLRAVMQPGLQILFLLGSAAMFGQLLTTTLGLAVLRPWVSAAEARTWLDLAAEGVKRERAWSGWVARFLLWPSPLYAWLVRVLWGKPINGPNAGAATHG